eukprot:gene16293-22480_t
MTTADTALAGTRDVFLMTDVPDSAWRDVDVCPNDHVAIHLRDLMVFPMTTADTSLAGNVDVFQ